MGHCRARRAKKFLHNRVGFGTTHVFECHLLHHVMPLHWQHSWKNWLSSHTWLPYARVYDDSVLLSHKGIPTWGTFIFNYQCRSELQGSLETCFLVQRESHVPFLPWVSGGRLPRHRTVREWLLQRLDCFKMPLLIPRTISVRISMSSLVCMHACAYVRLGKFTPIDVPTDSSGKVPSGPCRLQPWPARRNNRQFAVLP